MNGLTCDNELTAFKIIEKRYNFKPLSKLPLLLKSDSKANAYKNQADTMHHNSREVFNLYMRALYTAKYNSETYVSVLKSISEYYYKTKKWKECVNFINLCLKSNLKDPISTIELYIDKIRALTRMRNVKEAKETAVAFDQVLEKLDIPKEEKEKYAKIAHAAALYPHSIVKDNFYEATFQEDNTLLSLSKKAIIHSNSEYGRHVVAKKLIRKGETILFEKSYVSLGPMLCKYCCEDVTDIFPCDLCTDVLYCSSECKRQDEEIHQWECIIFQRDQNHIDRHTMIGLRVFLKELQKGFKKDSTLQFENSGSIPILQMFHNFKNIPAKSKLIISQESYQIITHLMKNKKFIDWLKSKAYDPGNDLTTIGTDLLTIVSICYNNDHGSIAEYFGKLGIRLYPNLSLFNHSCCPNAAIGFMDSKIRLKAIEDIHSGEQIFINYLSYKPQEEAGIITRKTTLREDFGVICNCRKCMGIIKDYEMACVNCGDYVYPPDGCLSCSKSTMKIQEIREKLINFYAMANERNHLESLYEAGILAHDLKFNPKSNLMLRFHTNLARCELRHGNIKLMAQYLPYIQNLYTSFHIKDYIEFIQYLKTVSQLTHADKQWCISDLDSETIDILLEHLDYLQEYMDLYYPIIHIFEEIKTLKAYYLIQRDILDFDTNHGWR